MKKSDFVRLHKDLKISISRTPDNNILDSDTDPTQDIPVKAIQMTASGIPINVKEYKKIFSETKIEDFTAVERRNTDVFDAVGEMQGLVGKVAQKGVQTTFTKSKSKTIKKYD